MSQIDQVFVQIAQFILDQPDFLFEKPQSTIKQHTEKLSQIGDIGFSKTIQQWLNVVTEPGYLAGRKEIINEDEVDFARKLIAMSSAWSLPIQEVKFKQFQCLIFLNRQKCYSNLLKTVLCDDASYGQWQHAHNAETLYKVQLIKQTEANSLVEHRCALVSKVLHNLLRISGMTPDGCPSNAQNLVEILITSAKRSKTNKANRQDEMELNNNVESRLIVCGNVSSNTGFSADDFIRLRSSEMEKMAESKHGPTKEKTVLEKCQKLGTAIVSFDMLKSKHHNSIDFDKLMSTTSSVKGAPFILYNVARLQTLLAAFDDQVSRRYYQPLPAFDQINYGLLKEEDEWQMFYVYIVGFPSMLERCVSSVDKGQIGIHLLCTFLNNLSALFSVYYHRTKILTDNLPHLMDVLHARIYLLKALRVVFLNSLSILEIEPLEQM